MSMWRAALLAFVTLSTICGLFIEMVWLGQTNRYDQPLWNLAIGAQLFVILMLGSRLFVDNYEDGK